MLGGGGDACVLTGQGRDTGPSLQWLRREASSSFFTLKRRSAISFLDNISDYNADVHG